MAKPIRRQRWSNIDVFGLLNGISSWDPQYRTLQYVRAPHENNLDLRNKIFRYHNNAVGITKQGLLNGLSNEFGYDPYNVIQTHTFQLTNTPFPSGDINVKDIWVEYREINSTGVWNSISAQIWGSGYIEAKEEKKGYIVWQNEKYVNISGIKNFNYSRILEIMEDLPDNQELRITYFVQGTDEDNNFQLKKFTDVDNLNNPNERYFVYREPVEISPLSGVIVYNLNDIPTGLYSFYYDSEDKPYEQLYSIKDYLNYKYKHTWGKMADASVIWDIHKGYGSGNIPHFFDVAAPQNELYCLASGKANGSYFSGYLGGNDYMSQSLYLSDVVETGEASSWFFKLYPGRFYLDGSPFYLFENPQQTFITFSGGCASIPSGLERGMHVILAISGYYSDGCVDPDPYLNGFVYEDHTYPVGDGGDSVWSYIYRRRGFIPSGVGYPISLDIGEYNIDFENNVINANVLDNDAVIIWDTILIPSGRTIEYDINPLNDELINLQKFFIYMVSKEN
jgi:hypothetical protein